MQVSKESDRKHHDKSWGWEDWIVNNDLYCGKRLHFDHGGGQTSLHYHSKKHETMMCMAGSFSITIVDPLDATRSAFRLTQGDSLVIPPNTLHRITALRDDSDLIEFSTHHEDDDSYRAER